jgi:Asp-tRNA(Asn)/Glu-tRNA(Gln) amidotransferase A subunit family amidase
MMAADGGARAREDLEPAGGRHAEQMSSLLEDLRPLALSAADFFRLVERWRDRRSLLRRFVASYDVFLYPVVAGPAPLHGCRPSDDGELTDYGEYGYAFMYAVAGVPSVVVPAGAERGLPVGVQVLAPAYRDHVALAAAAALEPALRAALPAAPAVAAAA